MAKSNEIYHIPPSISIPNMLQTGPSPPPPLYLPISHPATLRQKVAVSVRRALASYVVQYTLDAAARCSMQGIQPAAHLHRKNHVTGCRATPCSNAILSSLQSCLPPWAGRASRPHHVAGQSVPPSSFTSAARRKSHPSNPSRSRVIVADEGCARVDVATVCMTAVCEEPLFRATAAFGEADTSDNESK